MAVRQVYSPGNEDQTKQLIPMITGLVGSYYGGPAGGAAGGAIGQAAVGGSQDSVKGAQGGSSGSGSLDAAQRALDKENAASEIQKGMDSLQNMDPQTQQTYGPILQQALDQSQSTQDKINKLRMKEQTA